MALVCTAVSNSGFFAGLWDGLTAPYTLIASIFFDTSIFDACARSWWYECMFVVDIALTLDILKEMPILALGVFVMCLIIALIGPLFSNIIITAAIAFVLGALLLYGYFQRWRPS